MVMSTSDILKWFRDKISECENCRASLWEENREDEANFEKIRANVYDIFRTMTELAVKNNGDDIDKTCDYVMEKLQQIPSSWRESLTRARVHDDSQKERIEEIKLETVSVIETYLRQVRGNMK